jgi:tetratricopeptide (TPR) repeat protein
MTTSNSGSTAPSGAAAPAAAFPWLRVAVAGALLAGALAFRLYSDWNRAVEQAQPAALQVVVDNGGLAVERATLRVQQNPAHAQSYAELGGALLQQVRETGDSSLYARALAAFEKALALEPENLDALVGRGVLALALHDFTGALAWAGQAEAVNPYRAQILGIRGDALIELGRYEEATAAVQAMVDLRPDMHSYSRVSYVRELFGQVEGAMTAMELAARTSVKGSEDWQWATTHLANLHFNSGEREAASALYEQVLQVAPAYPFALAGRARVQAAGGNFAGAVATLRPVSERLPLPEFVAALGEYYERLGDVTNARLQYEIVGVMQTLLAAGGMNVDLELATFAALHGDDVAAAVSQARLAYALRPTLYAADTLAWALYRSAAFDEAARYSAEALRLGTQDALLYYHAGMIARAQGRSDDARRFLSTALTINPDFATLWAPDLPTLSTE